VAFDSNDGLMAQTNISIDAGNVANTTISSVNSVPSYVNLYSQECGDISDTISNINQ